MGGEPRNIIEWGMFVDVGFVIAKFQLQISFTHGDDGAVSTFCSSIPKVERLALGERAIDISTLHLIGIYNLDLHNIVYFVCVD